MTNYSWTSHGGPDVFFGGGAEQFLPGTGSYQGKDYYAEFAKKGYSVSTDKKSVLAADNNKKALGVFSQGVMPVWLDRNIYKDNLKNFKNDPKGGKGPALDLSLCNNYTRPSTQVSISQWIPSPAMIPSIRRYRQSYHTTLAAAFETEPETEEVIEVIPATQIEEDKSDEEANLCEVYLH
ncbi:hypothetical protein Trihar35433_2007 [Trichoderma harzianum]|nr:hypothetical protein Trihar35433_2007 [Trichoderma harzianum]